MKLKINAASSLNVSPSMRQYVIARAGELQGLIDPDQTVTVSIKLSKKQKKVKFLIHSYDQTIRGEATDTDFYAAVTKAQIRIKKNLSKARSRHLEQKRRKQFASSLRRSKQIDDEPMNIEEAIQKMEALDYDFFLFVDADTLKPTTLYARKDGGYGMLTLDSLDDPDEFAELE